MNRKDLAILILLIAVMGMAITADYLHTSIQTSNAFREGVVACQQQTALSVVKDLQTRGYTTLTIDNQTIPLVVYMGEA